MTDCKKDLIYDVGMHLGQDTAYYLSRGYRVVAIDAFPKMIEDAQAKFSRAIHDNRLVLLNYAMTNVVNDEVEFHISDKTEWNSVDERISTRQNQHAKSLRVSTNTLANLFQIYGVPYYCKIDVEGNDSVCLQSLLDTEFRPEFISCETECFSENQNVTEDQVLETLTNLFNLGYSKFKLIEQDDLNTLLPNVPYFKVNKGSSMLHRAVRKVFPKLNATPLSVSNRKKLSDKESWEFPYGSTGPFGDALGDDWLDYKSAKKALLYHRAEYFRVFADSRPYTVWFDWHATF